MTGPVTPIRDAIVAASTTRFVEANGLRHRILTFNDDAVHDVVFIPGITSPAETVAFIAGAMPEYRFHVPDLRGRGQTEAAVAGQYRLIDYADDLHGVIEAVELQSAAVIGHSLGARIAAAWVVRHDINQVPVLLVDPPTSGPGRPPYPMAKQSFIAQIDAAVAGTTPEAIRAHFPLWPLRELELRAEILAECDRVAVSETHDGFEREDFFTIWDQLGSNVALLYGALSPVVPAGAAAELAARNPGIPQIAIPAAGHMIPWDNLSGFVESARDALGSAPHPATPSLTTSTQNRT